jgi:CRISPR-associated protein Csx3
MVNLLPAILIGGPPHAGKSVLFSNLTRALSRRGIQHHAIRACPDGEGNWSQEIDQETVRLIRIKGQWSEEFINGICLDLERRHLPLLVDMGGHPEIPQHRIVWHCTHSLLLFRTDKEDYTHLWRKLVNENGLLPLAQLYSERTGADTLTSSNPIIQGTITSLERGSLTNSPLFEALLERIQDLFTYSIEELEQTKLDMAPTELVVHLSPLLKQIAPLATEWEPAMVPALLDEIPVDTAIAVFGRAPHWLYCLLAAHAGAQEFYQFDPRIGWIRPPQLMISDQTIPEVKYILQESENAIVLTVEIVKKHLDYLQAEQIPLPSLTREKGIILNGSMPSWFATALVRLYRGIGIDWIACFQPRLEQAVVIASRNVKYAPGDLIPMTNL